MHHQEVIDNRMGFVIVLFFNELLFDGNNLSLNSVLFPLPLIMLYHREDEYNVKQYGQSWS